MKTRLLLVSLCFWSFTLVTANPALAAPCCSGSSAMPALITGDDAAQLSAALSYGTVIGDARDGDLTPIFRSSLHSENTTALRLDGAKLLSDRIQAGIGFSILSRSFSEGRNPVYATRAGDLDLNLGYEFLPEWNYSAWKPRGHLFLLTTLPTGRSIYEAREPGLVDATGKGFVRLSLGSVLIKRWNAWDASLVAEIHHSFTRTFEAGISNPQNQRISAGWGTSFAIGGGYSPGAGDLRLGVRVQPSFAEPKKITTPSSTFRSGRMQTIDTSFEASYLLSDRGGGSWTTFASYIDQTLLGPAAHSTLSRTFALGLQHRWDR